VEHVGNIFGLEKTVRELSTNFSVRPHREQLKHRGVHVADDALALRDEFVGNAIDVRRKLYLKSFARQVQYSSNKLV
jgi:hypothetical protein